MADYSPYKIVKGAFTSATVAVGTLNQLEGFAAFGFQLSGLGAETVTVTPSLNGSTFGPAIKPFDASLGAVAAASALSNGVFWLPTSLPVSSLTFTASTIPTGVTVSYIALY